MQMELINTSGLKPVSVLWDDTIISIVNPFPALEKTLCIYEKKLTPSEENPWIREIKRTRRDLFNVMSEQRPRVLQTYHGLIQHVIDVCEENRVPCRVYDKRLEFPKPKFDNMHGFRFKQRELLVSALLQNKSGLIGAPTRYGKTCLLINTARAYQGIPIVITQPGADLTKQMYEAVKAAFPHRKVVQIGAGSRQKYCEDINVVSMDSLDKCDYGRTELILIDEPHALVTDKRLGFINQFTKARRIGFGATLDGRFDGRDKLIEAVIGPVLSERTYLEAVDEGAICPLVVFFLKINIPWSQTVGTRDAAYKRYLFYSTDMADLTATICKDIFPTHWQTLIFIKNERQAELYRDAIGADSTIAMAKRLTKKEREKLFSMMQEDRIKRCLASDIYAQGVTFSQVMALINAAGGGDNTTAIQKPGRLAEVIDGKNIGVIVDYLYDCDQVDIKTISKDDYENREWLNIVRDSRARMKAYKRKGYEIVICENTSELSDAIEKRI